MTMLRFTRPSVMVLLVLIGLAVLGRAAAGITNCPALITDHLDWIRQKPGQSRGSHAVGVKMAAVKIRERGPQTYPWGHGAYAEGRLGLAGDQMTGRLTVVFSDRKAGKYRFDPAKTDLQDVTVFADGRVRVVLVSWSHTTLVLEDVQCYSDGFITGVEREGNGVSIVSLVLRKEVMLPGADGFRDWP